MVTQKICEKPDANESLDNDTEDHDMIRSEPVDVDIKPIIQDDPIGIEEARCLMLEVPKGKKKIYLLEGN